MSIYDRIGLGYDTTRRADSYLTGRLMALLEAKPGDRILDIGCGTGNYTQALAEQGLDPTGLDPSPHMLEQARSKRSDMAWVAGTAESIPFADQRFDDAIATLTIHHWKDLDQGFAEVKRVLRPGGRLVVFTSTPDQMRNYWLRHYFPAMMERSSAVMPTLERVALAAQRAGLAFIRQESYSVRPDLQDLFLYSSKHEPERYLDPHFRNGISSFALFSPPDELERGVGALAADIAQGRWSVIRDSYANGGGDYVHVVYTRE